MLTESTLKIPVYSSVFQIPSAQEMAITVSAEGMGFAVFQVGNAGNQVGILAKDTLSVKKVDFGSFIKHVNRNSPPKYLKSVAKHFTN